MKVKMGDVVEVVSCDGIELNVTSVSPARAHRSWSPLCHVLMGIQTMWKKHLCGGLGGHCL